MFSDEKTTGWWKQFRDLPSQSITPHTCSFRTLVLFCFCCLGQDQTSSWGIWKKCLDSDKHKFQLLYCLLWVASLGFLDQHHSSFCVSLKLICCTSLWQLFWLCCCNCQSNITRVLLYQMLDRAIRLSRDMWFYCAANDFKVECMAGLCSFFGIQPSEEETVHSSNCLALYLSDCLTF